MATTTKYFADGKVLKSVGQYAEVGDLPNAANLDDNVVAWVVAENSYYQVNSAAWAVATGLGGSGGADTVSESVAFDTATESLDFGTKRYKIVTISNDVSTLTFSDAPASGTYGIMDLELVQDATGGWDITWPASVEWIESYPPDLTGMAANEVLFIRLWTRDAGTTVYGEHSTDPWLGVTVPSGTVVGTTDSQTLTNKTLTLPTIDGSKHTTETLTFDTSTEDVDISGPLFKTVNISTNVSTPSFSNWPVSGQRGEVVLKLVQDATGGRTISWPAAVEWLSGEAPDLSSTEANEVTFIFLWSDDAGTTIYGQHTRPSFDEVFEFALSDETTALTTGTKLTWRAPYGFTLRYLRASVATAPTGAAILVDVNESGTTVLSTKLQIDAGEKTSTTAATSYVISDSAIADDAEITFDIDQIGSSTAGAGLKVKLYVTRTDSGPG